MAFVVVRLRQPTIGRSHPSAVAKHSSLQVLVPDGPTFTPDSQVPVPIETDILVH